MGGASIHTNGAQNNRRKSIFDQGGPKCRGMELLRDPAINKGTSFSLKERQLLGIHGLLPPIVFTQKEQAERILANYRRATSDLDKYIYLSGLHDRNEKLFYRVISENIEEMAPIIYTPTVGLACQKYGLIFRKPKGLYITINDQGHVYEILCNWPENNVKAIVVTDGERILGLGDLGSHGMGIPVGKLALYTAMGGMPPEQCLPIVLDVGTDNDNLLNDDHYTGLRHKRVRGHQYDHFLEEFMEAAVKRYGQSTLVQFEDFANSNAFRILAKFRNKYLTFNDDIQGTAAVAVAGMMASMRLTKNRLIDQKYLFQGAGEASTGIANLLVRAMMSDGISQEEAISKIWMVDSKGLLVKDRASGGMKGENIEYAKEHADMNDLEKICETVKPSVVIGAAAIRGAFTEKFLKTMAANNERPVIFALSNPTSMAECSAIEAYTHTEGRCIFASGSPFDPVEVNGKMFYPGQGNNAYIFPGVALGSILSGVHHIDDQMFLEASKTLASLVEEHDLSEGRVYPPLREVRDVSTQIATRILEYAYKENLAETYPEPVDKGQYVRDYQYSSDYESFLPTMYSWPGMTE